MGGIFPFSAFFFLTCVSFHFLFTLFFCFRFFSFSLLFLKVLYIRAVKGDARDGRSRHPPTHQSFRECKVNLAKKLKEEWLARKRKGPQIRPLRFAKPLQHRCVPLHASPLVHRRQVLSLSPTRVAEMGKLWNDVCQHIT